MTTFLRLARFSALVLLPPALAALAAQGVWVLGGGQARCFAELDLSTPGLICASGLNLLVSAVVYGGFHIFLALPLGWWAATRRLAMGTLFIRFSLVLLLLGFPLTWLRAGHIGILHAVWEIYAELGLPLFLDLTTATLIAKRMVRPPPERSSVAEAAA
jgi:hypothetical protein